MQNKHVYTLEFFDKKVLYVLHKNVVEETNTKMHW